MSPEQLTTNLQQLGLEPGDVVLVHTSMKGLGHVDGGPNAVIDALLATVGPEGTLLFPTLTGSGDDGPNHPPAIDLATTPCQSWVGIVPETARQRSNGTRSIHPTHSVVALGANQQHWTSGHEHGSSPCDESSPYFRLMEEGGNILLLGGVTHESNTSLHCIEEIAKVPYHLHDDYSNGTVILPSGEVVTVRNRLHLWSNLYSHLNLPRHFDAVAEQLEATGAQRSLQVGPTESTLIDAGAMRNVLLPILKEDPLFLLGRNREKFD